MKIEKQEALGSIYNISGGFFNNGNISAENIYINSEGDVNDLVHPNQEMLQIQFGINYLDDLISEQSHKKLIKRNSLIQITHVLNENREIAIVGNPGVGKTCLLYELSCNIEGVIYINLKNKSIQTVLLHLINKYNISAGVRLIDKIDVENGLELLQGLLLSSSLTFLIDECENSQEIIKRILPLKKHQNTFIYASQSRAEFDTECIEVITIGNFDEIEAKKFLEVNDINLDVLEFNELFLASKGSALYLYYFSQYSIIPLPKGVEQYHRAIWKKLDTSDKECIIYSSISQFPIAIIDLAQLLHNGELQRTAALIDNLRLINRLMDGRIEIFHPAFKNFVNEQAKIDGTLNIYKVKLGNYFKEAKEFVQAAYLLIDIEPESLEDFGLEILPELDRSGEFEFSNRIAFELLKKERDPTTEGYLKFCIYQNHRFHGINTGVEQMIDDAIRLFKVAGNHRLQLIAKMNKAMDLVGSGSVDEGRALIDSIMDEDDGTDPMQTGPLLVSLSKIYLDLHQYKKAADNCKRAFDIFSEQKDLYGMVSSMANLASSLNHFDGYRDLSRKYAHKLLDLKLSANYFGFELIAFNVLTSVYRQMKKYDEAKKYGALAVHQSQKFKLFQKTIMNLINYGNIFRDTKETQEALKIYKEALSHAVEMNIQKEVSRIHWIMSEIFVDNGDLEEGLELINRSIDSAKSVNYSYGVAHGLKERASILEAKGELSMAAINFEEAFNKFVEMGGMVKEANRCLTSATLLYMKVGDKIRLERLVRVSIRTFGEDDFFDLIGVGEYEENILDIHTYFEKLNEKYIEVQTPTNQMTTYLDYLKYCKCNLNTSKEPFKKIILRLCIDHKENANRLSILSVLIEQSQKLLEMNDLKEIILEIQKSIKSLRIRKTDNDIVFLSIDSDGFNLDINAHQDDLLGIKLCLAFLIFRSTISEIFNVRGKEISQKYCKIYFHEYEVLSDVMKDRGGIRLDFNDDIQSHIIKFEQKEYPLTVVINENYENKSDLIKFPENKCFLYLIRSLGCNISSHFYGIDIDKIYKLTKPITARMALLYGYTNVDDEAEKEFDYNLDLSKIDELIYE